MSISIEITPRPGQNYGPGKEPQAVRDAWDFHLEAQSAAEAVPEAELEIT